MCFLFHNIGFEILNDTIAIANFLHVPCVKRNFVEVQLCGEDKPTHLGAKMAYSSEGSRLRYISHTVEDDRLEIIQRSALIETKTVFFAYDECDTVSIFTEVKNISPKEIILEEVSSFVLTGLGLHGIDSAKNLYFTRFLQSHHAECQPRRSSFFEQGLFRGNVESQKRIACANIGSWSTKEELPQGIIEDVEAKAVLMFEIESNASWYYEIADIAEKYYLYLGGANLPFGGWSKCLRAGESYQTVKVALTVSDSVEGVLANMTGYRRHIAGRDCNDKTLPAIFNEYMHLSWDSPTEEQTKKIAPIVANTGVEYYVIDCGWHNEEDGNIVYPYVGQWKESKARFPNGVRATTDYIRSLGMKAGLWIEPEIVGIKCQEMLNYYDDDCFFTRYDKRIAVQGRYFLDYRNDKVRAYMSETIRRMVEDYGADYIKFDYNQDCGVGTQWQALTAGEGLELAATAFLAWVAEMKEKFPWVIFEGCSSGGMRMDYKTLSVYSLVSTSDQTDYKKYPYIAGNILSSVLPEQAAVWSYPVGVGEIGKPFPYNAEWVRKNISHERIIMNMINSFLGRMHLASHLELLNEEQLTFVKEGVEYYKTISEIKKSATPYFPNGFTSFGKDKVVAGLKTENRIYLAVWNLGGERSCEVNLSQEACRAEMVYPKQRQLLYNLQSNRLTVDFTEDIQARFFEITLCKD